MGKSRTRAHVPKIMSRKWRWPGHTLRKPDTDTVRQVLVCNAREIVEAKGDLEVPGDGKQ